MNVKHLSFNCKVKSLSITNGRTFYGAGSASLGCSWEHFGGIIYGYTESEVLLWTPISSHSHLIYVGGVWGDGSDKIHEDTVQITVKDISTNVSECPPPPDILNTIKIYNGRGRGSLTSYSCLAGFMSNDELSFTSCNGTHWMETNFSCSPSSKSPRRLKETANVSSIQEIVRNLKIPKTNTSSYERSLKCAYDPRPSSLTIGSVGVAILCLVAALLFLADCHTFLQDSV
ncbi:uncharacterized protein LOC133203376 [Saccostrea echinata]|uniref:uncharacterized protein LOC133203376 n=1 Tax=Saccostrea echinata TaxID=191078 RepID=UPI002A7FBE02|nr:uncharacterized protein LOC133203376 [Saccostrea echinata]